jgi:hypothetical protein
MRSRAALFGLMVITSVGVALADGTVTLNLTSSKAGQTVPPGSTVDWTISLIVTGQNSGLALFSVDLRQGESNPAKFSVAPAAGVPTAMANFSRPEGISNPGEGGQTTGYVGVQRAGSAGGMDLVQIGGGQNTFGVAGQIMGTNPNVVANVGQGGGVTVAVGSFAAPATPGTYVFRIDNALANVLEAVNPPPNFSPASAPTIAYSAQTFSFVVGAAPCPTALGDVNGDSAANNFDITPFVFALTHTEAQFLVEYPGGYYWCADVNADGRVDNFDITPFVAILTRAP